VVILWDTIVLWDPSLALVLKTPSFSNTDHHVLHISWHQRRAIPQRRVMKTSQNWKSTTRLLVPFSYRFTESSPSCKIRIIFS